MLDSLADQLGEAIKLVQLRNRGPTHHLVGADLAKAFNKVSDSLRGGWDGCSHVFYGGPKVAVVIAYVAAPRSAGKRWQWLRGATNRYVGRSSANS